jgi:hypothetical protein
VFVVRVTGEVFRDYTCVGAAPARARAREDAARAAARAVTHASTSGGSRC